MPIVKPPSASAPRAGPRRRACAAATGASASFDSVGLRDVVSEVTPRRDHGAGCNHAAAALPPVAKAAQGARADPAAYRNDRRAVAVLQDVDGLRNGVPRRHGALQEVTATPVHAVSRGVAAWLGQRVSG